VTDQQRERAGVLLTGPILSVLLGLGVPLVLFTVGFVGEVRTNRLRLDAIERELTVLRLHDDQSASDRRDLSERLSRLETPRLAPSRGRE
jgi:hypothetical protein